MNTRIHQLTLAAVLLAPLALHALTAAPAAARRVEQLPPVNRFLGPNFPALLETGSGNGIPNEGTGGDSAVPIAFPPGNRISVHCGITSNGTPPDITLQASNPDGSGRFRTLTITNQSLFAGHQLAVTDANATGFSYANKATSPTSFGTGQLLDGNNDGVFDQFRGTGTRGSGPVTFTVDLVTIDIPPADGKADYVTLANGLSAALPDFIVDPQGFCQTSNPQRVFVPLADCSGDGIPDCIAVGTTSALPQYFRSPTLAGPTVDLSIVKTDGPDPIAAGQTLTYTLVVANAGAAAAQSVSVSDPLPPGATFVSMSTADWTCGVAAGIVTCTRPTLAAGATAPSIAIVVRPSQGGTLTNTATVTSTVPDRAAANNTSTATTTVTTVDLSIVKTDAPDPVAFGGTLVYTLAVSNAGPASATNVRVTDPLPAGVTFVSATGTGWTCNPASGTVTCTLATLAVGAAPPIALTVTAPATAGTLTNTATVTNDVLDSAAGNNSGTAATTVANTVDLSIAKTDAPDPVAVSGTLVYTLAVSNAGPASATNVRVTDPLPAGVTFVSATGTGWTCAIAAGTVTCTRATLAVGAAPPIAVTVTAPATTGTLNNTAAVTNDVTDSAAGNNNSSATTTVVNQADLSIAKTASAGQVAVGGTLVYTLAVSNAGPAVAQNVRVADTLPAGTVFVSATGTGWTCALAAGVVTCTRPTLAVGAAPPIALTVTAPASTGPLSNTATVTSDTPDLTAANNTSTATVTVVTSVSVALNGLASGASISSTSPFLDLSGTASVVPATASIVSVTWANNRGGSGTAAGTTSWRAQFIPLQAGVNVLTITAADNSGNTAVATLTVTVSQLLYFLAEGATGPFFDLDLLIANPNAVAAPVQITFLKEDGSTIVRNDTLPATSQRTLRVNSVPGLATGAVSAVVASTTGVPLVVERSMFWDAAPALGGNYYGGHTAEAVSSPNTQWLFAEGSQGFFDTFLLLANANPSPTSATITFLLEGAPPVVRNVTVGATSRLTIHAGQTPELVGRSFGIRVASTLPIIAERAMYFSAARFFEGGHESAGVNEAATRWFLAEGATGSFFDTFVLVSNSNSSPSTLTVTYLLSTGVSIVKTYVVPASGRITIDVEREDARLASTAVSTTVSATLPVVVERAMYWSGGFTTWYEAHNAFGVTAAGTRWGLAEGRVGGPLDFQTFILLANANSTPANVQITYLRANGTTVVKNYVVPATSRFNVWANADVPELANESFGAVVQVTNGVEIAVERAVYWNGGGLTFTGGTNANATRIP